MVRVRGDHELFGAAFEHPEDLVNFPALSTPAGVASSQSHVHEQGFP
jgi:hypothetical protein